MSVYQHVHPAGSTLVTVPMIGTPLKLSLSFKIKIAVDAPWIFIRSCQNIYLARFVLVKSGVEFLNSPHALFP